MQDTNYNFPVELQPIYFGKNIEIPGRRAVVRTDTNTPLGVVSDGYGLIKHEAVIDAFREAGKKYNVKESITLLNDGAHLYYQMLFPKVEMEIAKGDIIQMMITVKNSYNGHGALQIIFGAYRLVCLNGMVIGSEFLQFQYRHMGNVKGLADASMIEQCSKAYKHHIDIFGKQLPKIQAMAKTPVINADSHFDKENLALPAYLLDEAKTSYETEKDKSVWGYYNALTYAITHKQKKENAKQIIRQGQTAWKAAEAIIV